MSSMKLENFSLVEFRSFCEINGMNVLDEFNRIAITYDNYDNFIKHLYKEMETSFSNLEKNCNICKDDCENRLTISIVDYLKARGFNATHDENHGGHCDLTVHRNNYTWLGEAKIFYSSYAQLFDGFNQLTTRYSSATYEASHGGLIIYIKAPNANEIMKKWSVKIGEKQKEINITECPSNNPLRFQTSHVHQSSGLSYTVRHMGVVLHYDPK